MLSESLFEEILIDPVKSGSNQLFIVSGYATATMAVKHIFKAKQINNNVKVDLVVGMTSNDGLSLSNHIGFKKLVETDLQGAFRCSYVYQGFPVHAKVYCWLKDGSPVSGFIGSANYTQSGFGEKRREAMSTIDPAVSLRYFKEIEKDTIYCNHDDVENRIKIYSDKGFYGKKKESDRIVGDVSVPAFDSQGLEFKTLSFLDNKGDLPQISGLNWAHRKEKYKRELNQAYIRLTAEIYRSDFFPERGIHFTIQTDDGKILIATRAQQSGKAIHTPANNSLMGEYFRNRLGLPSGALVSKKDLESYGRTDVTFYKIEDETYLMDFSV